MLIRCTQVAARQYYSVAEILLTLYNPLLSEVPVGEVERRFAEDHALRVCGLAFTNDNVSARVNAFSPLSFVSLHFRGGEHNLCRTNRLVDGRCLTLEKHREGLVALLTDISKPVAWPIGPIIRDLTVCWGSK
jgi:hypothetical protein